MRTIIYFLMIVVSTGIMSCTSDVNVENYDIPELITVKNTDLDEFIVEYSVFINKLSDNQRAILESQLSSSNYNSSSRTAGTDCDCQSWESSCSAEGNFSSCCICWDPNKETGACGSYFGIASCKTEKKEDEVIAPPRLSVSNNDISYVHFQYAAFFNLIKDFGESNNINVDSVLGSLDQLKNKQI